MNPAPAPELWKKHPLVDLEYPALSREEIARVLARGGDDTLVKYVEERNRRIDDADADPLRKGFELPHWPDVRHLILQKDETYILGANDSGKTELVGKLACEVLTGRLTWPNMHPGKMKVLCVAQSEGASKQYQQPAVYKYLPTYARKFNAQSAKKRSVTTNINYSQKGGFTEGAFVLPNGAQCWFKTVEQYQRDPTGFEGPAYHLVIIDEPAPLSLVQTLGFRAAKVGGKIVFCFTAVHGFDAVCANVLTGARLVKSLPMNWDWLYPPNALPGEKRGGANPEMKFPELSLHEEHVKGCPEGHMPYIMQPLDFAKGVIFTWAHWNPFPPRSNFNRFLTRTADKCVGKGKRIAKVRLFGWAEQISGCQFPSFKPDVHVLPHAKIEAMLKAGKLTSYMSNDPRPAKSHFLLWMGVDKLGRRFVFDESPRFEEAEWASIDGETSEGPAFNAGRGTNWYKKHIREREREHGQEAFRRKGDPRAFATEAAAKDGGKSLLDLFASDNSAEDPDLAPMIFEGAKVKARISIEIEVINDAIAYDDRKDISVENEPKLYISERCANLIRSMLNWSPDQGEDSPWKDPIDALRYLFDEVLYYQDPNVPEVVGGKGWG
jgi:hypothetical protein